VGSEKPDPQGWDKPASFAASDTAVRQSPSQTPVPRKSCPFCCELIYPEARKCPHCQEYLDAALAAERAPLKPVSGWAKASLWLGLLSPVFLCLPAPLAAFLGFGALVSPRRRKTRGKGLAFLGMLLGLFWTAVLVLAALKARGYVPPSERLPLF